MDLSVEDVIALEPDLILWTRSDNTQATYDKLSAIAPTVGPPPGLATAYGTTVEQQTELVAKALGKESEGKALLDGLDAKFEAAIAANPNFAGKTAAVGAYSSDGYGAYVPGDARADFMTRLGFTIPTAITEKATGNFYIPVANENLNLFGRRPDRAVPDLPRQQCVCERSATARNPVGPGGTSVDPR